MKEEHIFAICAYKESAYLEACIQSLKRQTRKSKIILATSTPNTYIENLCSKYQIPMYVNKGEKGITQDWNFAYQCADSRYVTIAHQDDVYLPDYWEKVYNHIKRAKKPLIAFGDYGELRNKKNHAASAAYSEILVLKIYKKAYFVIWMCNMLPFCYI